MCRGLQSSSSAFLFFSKKGSCWVILGKLYEVFDRAVLALNISVLRNSTPPEALSHSNDIPWLTSQIKPVQTASNFPTNTLLELRV